MFYFPSVARAGRVRGGALMTVDTGTTTPAAAPPGSSDHLLVERRGHVVIVTMNRPEAKNAFSPEMLARMADAWDLVDADPDVRIAILTGAGNCFCAGTDLKLMAKGFHDPVWSPRFKADPDLHWKALLRHY